MEFVIYFADSGDWASDNSDSQVGNSFVIPQCSDPKLWTEILDQETSIDEEDHIFISIPRMIRELQDAGLWDKLIEEAEAEKKEEKEMPKFANRDDEEQYLNDFAVEWSHTENPVRDEFIPAVIRLDEDRGQAVTQVFTSLMSASHKLRNRTLFPRWQGQGLVCGNVDISLRPTAGDNIAAANELADLLDNFVRKHAKQFGFSQVPRVVGVNQNHALVKDGTIEYVGKPDED